MASLPKLGLFFSVLVPAIFFLSQTVHSKDEKDNLLQAINSYRSSLNLPPLAKNDNAGCLADQVAEQLEDQPCPGTSTAMTSPGSLSNYPKLLSKCKIDVNSTRDGAILPVCVHDRVPTLVLTNYTRTNYAKYLNDSKYTGAGLGSEDDWMVVVLSTNSPAGSFANGGLRVSMAGSSRCLPLVAAAAAFFSLLV